MKEQKQKMKEKEKEEAENLKTSSKEQKKSQKAQKHGRFASLFGRRKSTSNDDSILTSDGELNKHGTDNNSQPTASIIILFMRVPSQLALKPNIKN